MQRLTYNPPATLVSGTVLKDLPRPWLFRVGCLACGATDFVFSPEASGWYQGSSDSGQIQPHYGCSDIRCGECFHELHLLEAITGEHNDENRATLYAKWGPLVRRDHVDKRSEE
jgi:ribosomal protein S27E